jgi:predicted PurR-regulated permease PerM
MNESQRSTVGIIFSVTIAVAAIFITHRFILPLVWAAIICIATWPLYERTLARCGGRQLVAATIAVIGSTLLFITPLAIGIQQAMHQAPAVAAMVADANNNGLAPPDWLARLPVFGPSVFDWWQNTLSQPHGLSHLLEEGSVARIHTANEVLRNIGAQLMHRTIDAGFAIVSLFFFYVDGPQLVRQIDAFAHQAIGNRRWELFAEKVPRAIRATVNGLVLVGLAEGILIGVAYEMAGVPSAVLWAAATGILAIIPFGAPLAFLSVSALMVATGHTQAAVAIAAWGATVLFVADHFVRPKIIGNATQLPFLAVLFGILGGVETLGLVGLFVGPVVMTLFMTLWREETASAR